MNPLTLWLMIALAIAEAAWVLFLLRRLTSIKSEGAGRVVWFTGIPASGKSTLASAIEKRLRGQGRKVVNLDADEIRNELSPRLGWTEADRDENTKRLGWTAAIIAAQGTDVLVAAVSPKLEHRRRAREYAAKFTEVHVCCPIGMCRRRDPKGLYARAARGEVADIAGLHSPYEAPRCPEVRVYTDTMSIASCAAQVMAELEDSQARSE